MDEVKPVVSEKRQLECRYESKFIALSRSFRTIRILMQGPNPTVFHENCLPLVESFQTRP